MAKTTNEQKEPGQFAEAMLDAMEKKKMSAADVAGKIGTTYEHVRKLVNTYTFPSGLLLEKICAVLGLQLNKMKELVVADRLKWKYGDIPQVLAGKNPRFAKIEHYLPKLTPEQFRILEGILDGMVKSNAGR